MVMLCLSFSHSQLLVYCVVECEGEGEGITLALMLWPTIITMFVLVSPVYKVNNILCCFHKVFMSDLLIW